MKKVITLLFLSISLQVNSDETKLAQVKCQEEKLMAENIQYVRIVTNDTLVQFIDNINNWNEAETQREKSFWISTIHTARKVYSVDKGYSPEKVGLAFEHACYLRFGYRVEGLLL